MNKNIGIVWIRDDFRTLRNDALAYATQNHDFVCAFYIYKKKEFYKRSAQLWWLYRSLKNFRERLNELNINLEIVEAASYKEVFEKIYSKKFFSIYWNKVYEPNFLLFDKPSSNLLAHVSNWDYISFIEQELNNREIAAMPPFTKLILLRTQSYDESSLESFTRALLKSAPIQDGLTIYGPAPAALYKLRNKYRWHILLKITQSVTIKDGAATVNFEFRRPKKK